MSITIIAKHKDAINDATEHLISDSTTIEELKGILDQLERVVRHDFDMTVGIFNEDTSDCSIYGYEYRSTSTRTPRQWLLTNIGYAMSCKDTRANNLCIFPNLLRKVLDMVRGV
jgi:hypothetical protein